MPAASTLAKVRQRSLWFSSSFKEVEITFAECDPKHVTAAILTNDMHAYNTFEDPDKVHEEVFTEYKIADGRITFTMPACSVVMFRIK